MDNDLDVVEAHRELIRRDHERIIARWQSHADAAAAEGDERGMAFWQDAADRQREIELPWDVTAS